MSAYNSHLYSQNDERYIYRDQALSRAKYLRFGTWKNTRIELVMNADSTFTYVVKKFA